MYKSIYQLINTIQLITFKIFSENSRENYFTLSILQASKKGL
jgi:hypothetical protein